MGPLAGSPSSDVGAGSSLETGASPWGIFAGLAAFALSVAISPVVASRTFTPKFLVMLVVAGVGLVPLASSLRRPVSRERFALYGAAAFVVVALLSALMSQAPNIGVFGLYDWGTGWLMWLGCAGAFGVGCRLQRRDAPWLFGGILAGALANSVMALVQTLFLSPGTTFGPYQGTQADGFLGNPVFLESLLLGAVALVSVRAAGSHLRSASFVAWSACLALMGVALEFSDERAAVGLLALLFIALLVWYRARGLLAVLPTGLGYLVGYLGAGKSLAGRIAAGTSSVGFHQRIDLWKLALEGVVHRPLLGYGPGQLEAATLPHMSLAFARTLQPGKTFTDSHDILIEVAITTGILGLVCFAAWVGGAVLAARNYFVYFALMCLAVELVEPLNIAITPLLFLALGAGLLPSRGSRDAVQPLGTTARAGVAVLCVAALLLGGEMVAGDVALDHAPPAEYSLSNSKTSNSLLFYWPQSAIALTDYYRYDAAASHSRSLRRHYLELALKYSRETESRLPADPLAWVNLGDSELALGRFARATACYERALRADRWEPAAFDGLAQVDMERHAFAAATSWYRKELAVLPPGPERTAAEQHLSDARRGVVPHSAL